MPRRKTRHFPDYGHLLPNAGPDWIWRRAVNLVDSGRYATIRRDGTLVCRAARVYRAIKRGYSGRGDKKLYSTESDLISAESFENGPSLSVLEFKMRVLAGQRSKTLVAHLGMTESFVTTFEQIFFDVADRLGASVWIYRNVIGISPGLEISDEQMAMRDAYQHGSDRIDGWLDFLTHRFQDHDLTTRLGRQRESFALRVAAQRLNFDRETSGSLPKAMRIISETRAKTFRLVTVNDQVQRNTHDMLRSVRFRVSSDSGECVSRGDEVTNATENPAVHGITHQDGEKILCESVHTKIGHWNE